MTPAEERAAMANVAAAATALRDAIRASGLHILIADVDMLNGGDARVMVRDDLVVRASDGKYRATVFDNGFGDLPVKVSFDVGGVMFYGLLRRNDPLCERALLRARALEHQSRRTGPPGSRFASVGREE